MSKPFNKFFIVVALLLTGCSSNTDPSGSTSGTTTSGPSHDYNYQCSITWDGFTPSATFSIPDGSMTSDEIAALFDEKISQKVVNYPTEDAKGIREHKVKYVLKEDDTFFFESSTSNEEFEFKHIDTNAPEVINYLRAQSEQEQFNALMAIKGKDLDYSRYVINFHKYGREQTSLYLASDAAFTTDVIKYQTAEESYTLNYLIPGETYYWKRFNHFNLFLNLYEKLDIVSHERGLDGRPRNIGADELLCKYKFWYQLNYYEFLKMMSEIELFDKELSLIEKYKSIEQDF